MVRYPPVVRPGRACFLLFPPFRPCLPRSEVGTNESVHLSVSFVPSHWDPLRTQRGVLRADRWYLLRFDVTWPFLFRMLTSPAVWIRIGENKERLCADAAFPFLVSPAFHSFICQWTESHIIWHWASPAHKTERQCAGVTEPKDMVSLSALMISWLLCLPFPFQAMFLNRYVSHII
jgi:hypothetical protein